MPRTIPSALLSHLAQPMFSTSYRLRIGPLADGSYLCMTTLDRDETVDDGDGLGALTYLAATGLDLSTLVATNDLAVDNAEARTLVPVFPMPGITEEMINLGQLDTAPYVIFCHNYKSPGDGSYIHAGGVLGKCRLVQGLVVVPELLSWTNLLKQTGIISQTCLDCRTRRFGSQPGDERESCGYDISGEWVDFTVAGVGDENVREFYAPELDAATYAPDGSEGYFAPGMVKWQAGENAGQSLEVESFVGGDGVTDGYVSLRFTTRKAIQPGDSGQIRRDCTRKWTGHNSCETYHGAEKGAHFNGEPNINIGDSTANSVPGVNMTTSTGGTGE